MIKLKKLLNKYKPSKNKINNYKRKNGIYKVQLNKDKKLKI